MNLSISNIAWGFEHDAEMYRHLHEADFQGLEIAPTRIFPEAPYDHLEEAKDWAIELKEKYSLVISSMQSIWYGRSEKIFGTREERQVLIDYTKKAIDFAETIGCGNLVFGNPKNRDTDDVVRNYPVAIEFFKEIGEYVAEKNAVIAIEANPTSYNTRFINKTEQAVELADKCNCKGIKVNVDLGAIIYNEEDINYLKQISEYINHVHISEPGLKIIEEREIHHRLFSILAGIDYKKYLSIEMGNCNDVEMVKQAMDYVKMLNIWVD